MVPATVPVIFTVQLPDERVQVLEENVTLPDPETFNQVIVPVWVEYAPVTVALQVSPPTANVVVVHVIVVCVPVESTVSFSHGLVAPLLLASPE